MGVNVMCCAYVSGSQVPHPPVSFFAFACATALYCITHYYCFLG